MAESSNGKSSFGSTRPTWRARPSNGPARRRSGAAGCRKTASRHAEETLRQQRSVLRVRNEGHRSLLTFKGPVQPGPMKVREELETVVTTAT